MNEKRIDIGTGVGQGHGGQTAQFPPIVERPFTRRFRYLLGPEFVNEAQTYVMGSQISIIVTRERGWHMSIAHPKRYPTWDEVAHVRYELIPDDVTMVMVLPPRDQYVNLHNFCFQLHESTEDWSPG